MAIIASISGIRGTIGGPVGQSLSPIDIVKFALAYGTWLAQQYPDNLKVVIGRDARISGDMVNKLVVASLQSVGISVVDLGMATTPTVEIAVVGEQAAGGIVLSASHNPAQWNALKLLNAEGEFLSRAAGEAVLNITQNENYQFANVYQLGSYELNDTYLQKHINAILALPLVDVAAITARNFTILVDAVNSVGGIAVPALLEALGVSNIIPLYCEPNGNFPHNPEPLPRYLATTAAEVQRTNADLGIVVDPDVDRLAMVCEDGSMFGEEYTLVSIADYVLQHQKGVVVSNLSSTKALKELCEKNSCTYHASAVGEVNVVAKMKATNAVIGGEGNGGIIVPQLHYGRDALVGIALFLSHLAKFGKSCSLLRRKYPFYHLTKQKIELTPDIDVDMVLDKMEQKYKQHPINTIDGLKIWFDNDWVHLRKSNTEPIIRIYAESSGKVTANAIVKAIINDVGNIVRAANS